MSDGTRQPPASLGNDSIFDRLFRDDPNEGLLVIRAVEPMDAADCLLLIEPIAKTPRLHQTKADWKRSMQFGKGQRG